jgi:tetratricopeptide (TPR) repeat protein
MEKIRFRLRGERVIGPFSEEEYRELLKSGKISPNDEYHEYPQGDWKIIKSNTQLMVIAGFISEKTQSQDSRNQEVEKTRINLAAQHLKQEAVLVKKDAPKNEKNQSRSIKTTTKEVSSEETQLINLQELKTEIYSKAKFHEVELKAMEENLLARQALQKKEEEGLRLKKEMFEKALEKKEEKKQQIKRLTIISTLLLGLWFLLEPSEKKAQENKLQPLDPMIAYPLPFEESDPAKAKQLFDQSLDLLQGENFPALVAAAKSIRESWENDKSSKSVQYKLVRVYAQLLEHSLKKEEDQNIVFKLLQTFHLQKYTEPEIAHAYALFYRQMDKTAAAQEVIEKFMQSQQSLPSQDLYNTYLVILSDLNFEEKADEVARALLKIEKKKIQTYLSLITYYDFKNYPQESEKILLQAVKEYPESVPLLLRQAQRFIQVEKKENLRDLIKKLQSLKAEQSAKYISLLNELRGHFFALSGDITLATKSYTEALETLEDPAMKDRISKMIKTFSMDKGKISSITQKIFNQIISKKLIQDSQKRLERFDNQGALLTALEAQKRGDGFLLAEIYMSEMQFRLGLISEGIGQLENLYKKNPEDVDVVFALTQAYITYFKLPEAQRILAQSASSEKMRLSWQHASLNAQFYEKSGDLGQSIFWLQKAINTNPLSDTTLFSLAKLFTQAKKFDTAKNYLFRAMELNPQQVEYKLFYANIVYEMDGADAAVSYLYGVLKNYPSHPAVLGEVAIYYYRAGKTTQYLEMRRRIDSLPIKDPRIFKFLVTMNLLDEKLDEAAENTQELLKLAPDQLSVMMDVAKAFMNAKRFKEAAIWFVKLKEKLPNYPRVGFYKSKIELYLGDREQAIRDVLEDIKLNGDYEEGVVHLGNIYQSQEKYLEAEAEYKKGLKINNRSVGALKGLGTLSFKRGQYDSALDLFRRAIVESQSSKPDPELYRQIGDLYRLTGQGALAIEAYNVYLKLNSEAHDRTQIERYIKLLE